jgi:hypothetical protein
VTHKRMSSFEFELFLSFIHSFVFLSTAYSLRSRMLHLTKLKNVVNVLSQ